MSSRSPQFPRKIKSPNVQHRQAARLGERKRRLRSREASLAQSIQRLENRCLLAVDFTGAWSMGGASFDQTTSIETDTSGNVVAAGTFRGTVDFDPGPGTFEMTSLGPSDDAFITKYDSSGNLVWARQFEADYGYVPDIATDAAGNVYFASAYDLAKLDKDGNVMWSFPSPGVAQGVALDSTGNLLITGDFSGTVDFDPGAGNSELTSAGMEDVFVMKLDIDGGFVWARALGGTSRDNSRSGVAVDTNDNVITTGLFEGTADFDPGIGTVELTSNGIEDVFISKLDSEGNFVWAKAVGGTSVDIGYGMAVDSMGAVYAGGLFEGTVDFDPGTGTLNLVANGSDGFILKLGSDGSFLWVRQIGGAYSDRVTDIAVNALDSVYTAGSFRDTVDFDPSGAIFELTSQGGTDGFVSTFTSDGAFLWAASMGGTSNDNAIAVGVAATGDVYAGGFFYFTADFDPSPTNAYEMTAVGEGDAFISKYTQSAEDSTLTQIDVKLGSESSRPRDFTEWRRGFFFTADLPGVGRELFYSDGTVPGTRLVRDLVPGSDGSYPRDLVVFDDRLFFTAFEPGAGRELWVSDGSESGTVRFKDLRNVGGSFPQQLTVVNDLLYFSADDGIHGSELWASDGSDPGTQMIRDIRRGAESSDPLWLTASNGRLLFTADNGVNGRELWKSEGLATNTRVVRDIFLGSDSSDPAIITDVAGTAYFVADNGIHGRELWKTDGSRLGTSLVRNTRAGSDSSDTDHLTDVNGTLYFTADDGNRGNELWKSDGTPTGTVVVRNINFGAASSNPSELTNVEGTLFFSAFEPLHGIELWKSDGTQTGTVMVRDIWTGTNNSAPMDLVNFGGKLFFNAFVPGQGRELWVSSGTQAGTKLFADLNPIGGSAPTDFVAMGVEGLVFHAYDDAHGDELWVYTPPSMPFTSMAFSAPTDKGPSSMKSPESIDKMFEEWANDQGVHEVAKVSPAAIATRPLPAHQHDRLVCSNDEPIFRNGSRSLDEGYLWQLESIDAAFTEHSAA